LDGLASALEHHDMISPTDVANSLRILHQLKCKLLFKNCTLPKIWPEYFLLHPEIKQYLVWAMETAKKNQEFEVIQYWLKELISPIDLAILEPTAKEFTDDLQCIYCSNVANSVPETIRLETEHLFELFKYY